MSLRSNIWWAITVIASGGLATIFAFFFEFTQGHVLVILGLAGTMLSITAAVAVFTYQVTRERSHYWADRILQLQTELETIPEGDRPKHLSLWRGAHGPLGAGIEELGRLQNVTIMVLSTGALLLASEIFSVFAVFGPAFTIGDNHNSIDEVGLFGSLAVSSILLASMYLTIFVGWVLRLQFVSDIREMVQTFGS